jgi:hypothetical protein
LGRVWEPDAVSLHVLPKTDAIVQTLFIKRADAFASSALTAFLQHARPKLPKGRRPPLAPAADRAYDDFNG